MPKLLRPLIVRGAYCLDGKPVIVRTEHELADQVQKAIDASATSEVKVSVVEAK